MYVPNFNFLAQFGEELWEEQTQKIEKPDKKNFFLGLWRGEMGLKHISPRNWLGALISQYVIQLLIFYHLA